MEVGGPLDALRQPRYLFDSGRLFFDSADGLVGQAANGVEDVYEFEPEKVGSCSSTSSSGSSTYKPERTLKIEEGTPQERTVQEPAGCVGLISSGSSSEESAFLDASAGGGEGEDGEPGQEGGDNVFFLTSARLSPLDVDSARDVYDAHVCGVGWACPTPSPAPPVCEGDACQNVVAPPGELTPGSLTFSGPGNLAPPVAKPAVKSLTRAQKLADALRTCRKDKKKAKRRRCEASARAKYGAAKKAKKSAHTNRRAGR
jgi:hypothetical protein